MLDMAKKTKEIIEKNVTESLDDIMSLRFDAVLINPLNKKDIEDNFK